MKKYIAYFDYLGFKDFIEKNDLDYQKRIMNNNFRDIELSLSNGETTEGKKGLIGDRSKCKISCMNFSDTVVFWTTDDSYESLLELIQVAFNYNFRSNLYSFPTKGAIVFGELMHVNFMDQNSGTATYNVNSLYGKGLVLAHLKSEQQDWAGTVIDQSVIDELTRQGVETFQRDITDKACLYKIPYKNGLVKEEEFALRLVNDNINEETYFNLSKRIENNFGEHNKSVEHEGVKRKLKNTIEFLYSFVKEG